MQNNNDKFVPFPQWIAGLERRASSAGVIIENKDGEVLAVKAHYKPYWSTPGGMIDAGESPKQAAVREVHEEIGQTIDPADISFSAVIHRHSKTADTYLFVFRLNKTMPRDVKIHYRDGEIEEVAWLSRADITTRKNGRKFNRALKNWASDHPSDYIEHMI